MSIKVRPERDEWVVEHPDIGERPYRSFQAALAVAQRLKNDLDETVGIEHPRQQAARRAPIGGD